MDRLYKNADGSVRGCGWVEGTDINDNMVCLDYEYLELLEEEHAYYHLENFIYTLPKPLQIIMKPFFDKYTKNM